MISTSATAGLRLCRIALLTLAAVTPFISVGAHASQLVIEWASSLDGTQLSIDAGADRLYSSPLQGGKLIIDPDAILGGRGSVVSALVSLENQEELAIGINLFSCGTACSWRLKFKPLQTGRNFRLVSKICQGSAKTVDAQIEKYLYCRKNYPDYASNDPCWPEALNTLTGWFEAAYKLKEITTRDGASFFARDNEVERKVIDTLAACPDFEVNVRRGRGYFSGMINNLDIAVLQRAQFVQKKLNLNDSAGAFQAATELVKKLEEVAPIREKVSVRDTAFVEGVVRRSLSDRADFSLR